ncbi:hypothetical protein BaRGS_00010907 [Batillaria attramentaria]|uniref:Uncharacterized protein n=1 Tax=Batillaria attramentaria TaxID=370345 RepID=A0ABD0LEV4_9CAEN
MSVSAMSCLQSVCRRRVVVLLLMCTAVMVAVVWRSLVWSDDYKLETLVAQLEEFGPERGYYDFTVVTGLFDIGRGHRLFRSRTYKTYLAWLIQILTLDVNLIVFIEPQGMDFVRRIRRGREGRTLVVETNLSDLPYFKDMDRIQIVMNSQQFQSDNVNWQKGKIEATDPLYIMVTNCKAGLMGRAIQLNHFYSHYWIWLDAGLTHGNLSMFPPDGVWHPRHLLQDPDHVTFTAFQPMEQLVNVTDLHKRDTAPLAGGVFAGGTKTMLRYVQLHDQAWEEMLRSHAVDDDQTTFTLAYLKHPGNFNPIIGGWFDLIRPWT